MAAIEGGAVETMSLLMSAKADIGARNVDGMTLLNMAAEQAAPNAVSLLCSHGLDPYREDKSGYMPIMDMILDGDKAAYVFNSGFDLYRLKEVRKGLFSLIIELNLRGAHTVLEMLGKRLAPEMVQKFVNAVPASFVSPLCSAVNRGNR